MSHIRAIALAAVAAVFAVAAPVPVAAEPAKPEWRLTTVVGIGEAGYSGDGGPATEARISGQSAYGPRIAVTGDGTLYVAEWSSQRLRRVTPNGVIDTVLDTRTVTAGGPRGVALSGDGTVHLAMETSLLRVDPGGATEIPTGEFSILSDVTADSAGNIYYVATESSVDQPGTIVRVDRSGATTTIAVETTALYSIAAGQDGTVYFTTGNFRPDGQTVHAIGPDGVARTAATMPSGDVAGAVEIAPDGTPYVVNASRGELLRIGPQGTLTRLGPSLAVGISDVAFGPDNTPYLVIGATVRRLEQVTDDRPAQKPATPRGAGDAPGTVHRLAGTGETPATDQTGLSAPAVGPDGTVYVAQPSRNAVFAIDRDGRVERFAGNGKDGGRTEDPPALDGKKAANVALDHPHAVAADTDGNVYIHTKDAILRVAGDGIVSTAKVLDRFSATAPDLARNHQLAVDDAGAFYYTEITDVIYGAVRKVGRDGATTIVAGDGERLSGRYSDNVSAVEATLRWPTAVSVGEDGTVYVIETGDDTAAHAIRAVRPDGVLVTVAGDAELERSGSGGFAGDGGPATSARLNNPRGVVAGPGGSFYIADTNNGRVRQVERSGVITTVAGNGRRSETGDDRPAVSASLKDPTGLAVGADGTLYITSTESTRVRAVSPDGTITTHADLDAAPAQRLFAAVDTLEVGPDGTVYFGSRDGVTSLTPDGSVDHVAGLTTLSPIATGPDGSVYQLVQIFQESQEPAAELRRRYPNGTVARLATDKPMNGVTLVAVGPKGEIHVASETEVFRLDGGSLRRVLSTGDEPYSQDGTGGEHKVRAIAGGRDGALYVVAVNQVVAVRDGKAELVAGNGDSVSSAEAEAAEDGGPARDASLYGSSDVAVADDGTLFIATEDGVRRVRDGVIETLVAADVAVRQLAVGPSGDLYAASAERVLVMVRPGEVTVDRTPWLWIWLGAGGVVLIVVALVLYRRRAVRATDEVTPEPAADEHET